MKALVSGVTLSVMLALSVGAEAQFEVNPTATGQKRPGRLEVSGFVGSLSIDQVLGSASNLYHSVSGEATNIDFGRLFGFRASWAFTPKLAAEFNFSGGNNAYTLAVNDEVVGMVDLGEQFDTDQLFLGGNVLYHFPVGNFAPYVTGGAGLLRTTPTSSIAEIDRVSAIDVNFGGGAKFWFSSPYWLGLRFDLRYHTASEGITFPGGTSSPKGFELSVGASVRFF